METLQRHLPNFDKQPHYTVSTFSTSSSPSASSSLTDSQDDLLPDLWLEPSTSPHAPPPQALHVPRTGPQGVASPTSIMAAPFANYQLTSVAPMQGSMMLRDASMEYAQLLLPHSLLAPLTEENLGYNLARVAKVASASVGVASASPAPHYHHHRHDCPNDGLFNFEQQQAQQARPNHHNHNHNHNNHQKSRQGSVSSTGSSKGKNINTQLYKTELCVSFIKMGLCPYGTKCQFAHGEHDLKKVERPANWRSKPCVNWAKFGSCRYGKRCCFKHGD